MEKKILAALLCFLGLIIFISTLHGQGSKKTVTLPNGEVVCDLNGEWDALYENLGAYQWVSNITDMLKIGQHDHLTWLQGGIDAWEEDSLSKNELLKHRLSSALILRAKKGGRS